MDLREFGNDRAPGWISGLYNLISNLKDIRKITLLEIIKTFNQEDFVIKKNRSMTGKGDQALAGWQIQTSTFFAVEKTYVPFTQRDLFYRTIFLKISEVDYNITVSEIDAERSPVYHFIKRYDSADKNILADDIIKYYLREKVTYKRANNLISPILNIFDMATLGTVANYFGDSETAKKIEYCLLTNRY